ncbi:MAG: hypothetical protein JXB04_00460 [Kiritimatiellae bacterium]|nr:hypothetical protein [Kiritimatiellia bacterium]
MRTVLGIVCVAFGLFGWVGQLISGLNYSLAQKLGLQEKAGGTDPLFRRAERNTARWDALVLWPLSLAGILMLANLPWWPYIALIAGGIYLDAAGREVAKLMCLRKEGIRIGSPRDQWIAATFFLLMLLIALSVIVYALAALA